MPVVFNTLLSGARCQDQPLGGSWEERRDRDTAEQLRRWQMEGDRDTLPVDQ